MKGEQTPLPPEPPLARLVVSDVMELRRMRSFYADATLHARLLAIVEHRLGHALLGAAEAAKIAVADAGSTGKVDIPLNAVEDGLAGHLTEPEGGAGGALSARGRRGGLPLSPETMLRIHFMQQWFALSDPAMKEALHDMPVFREFSGLEGWHERLPDESTILRFRHVLKKRKMAAQILQTVNGLLSAKGVMLKSSTVFHATLIAAPSATKNSSGERDPEMKQSHKGRQWYFGMTCHIGVDIGSGLVHAVHGTSGVVNDVMEANILAPESDREVHTDAGYQGAGKRPDGQRGRDLEHRDGARQAPHAGLEQASRGAHRAAGAGQAGIRARVEHPF